MRRSASLLPYLTCSLSLCVSALVCAESNRSSPHYSEDSTAVREVTHQGDATDKTRRDMEKKAATSLLPSEELLEFLLEFEKVDNETFHLLVQRGIHDVEKKQK